MVAANVKSYYNYKPNSFQKYGASRDGGARRHRGTDFSHSSRPGTLVPALIAGRVTGKLKPASWHGFGYQITTEGKGPDGRTYRVSYAHGAKAQSQSVGTSVSQGTYLSTEGTTGATSGSCMHLEVYDVAAKKFIDPMILVKMVLGSSGGSTSGGSSSPSNSVKKIQRKVNLFIGGVKDDGVRGPITIAAIKKFQRKYGLVSDGIWGPKTDAMWYRLANRRKGERGNVVKLIQKLVGAKQDGIFGNDTLNKVKAFQKKNGLTADGIVGSRTWAKMGY